MSAAFALSERFDTPVLLRMTTRVCHSTSVVELGEPPGTTDDKQGLSTNGSAPHPTFPRNPAKYVMVPGNAMKRHPLVEQRLEKIAEFAESFAGNVIEAGDPELGIITAGIAYQYVKEVFASRFGTAPRHDLAPAPPPNRGFRRLREAPDRR